MKVNPFADLISQLKAARPEDPILARRLNELISVNELVTSLHTSENLDEILDFLLLTVLGEFPCFKGAILIRRSQGWELGRAKGLRGGLELEPLSPAFNWDGLPRRISKNNGEIPPQLAFLISDQLFHRIFPMFAGQRLVGMICLGKSLLGSLEEAKAAQIANMAGIGAVVLSNWLYRNDLEDLNRLLQRRVFQLNSLYEIASAFARCYDNESVYQILANNLMGQFFISRCAVLDCHCHLVFRKGLKLSQEELQFSESQRDRLQDLCSQGVTDALALEDEKLVALFKKHKIKFLAPISSEGKSWGILLLGARMNRQNLNDEDRDFVVSLAQQAGTALENVELHIQLLEKKRMEKELELARDIQRSLLPKAVPRISGYDIAVEMEPFKQVGGDFYDFIDLDDGLYGICCADVSGKSLPASMIMSTTQASLRALTSFKGTSPVEILERLNRHICASTQNNKYVTMFYAVLDTNKNELSYINAGHNRPLLLQPDNSIRFLDKGGMVVGLFSFARYEMETVSFEPGSELLIFTDGLSEIMDPEGEEYGDERLVAFMNQNHGMGCAQEYKDCLVGQVKKFGAGKMIDDLTVIFLRRNAL